MGNCGFARIEEQTAERRSASGATIDIARARNARGLAYSDRSKPHLLGCLVKYHDALQVEPKGGILAKQVLSRNGYRTVGTDGRHKESIAYMKINQVGTTCQ